MQTQLMNNSQQQIGNYQGYQSQGTSNCTLQQWPYQGYSWPTRTYICSSNDSEKRMGEFDLHMDRNGNLRVIRDGVLLQTFKPKEKK